MTSINFFFTLLVKGRDPRVARQGLDGFTPYAGKKGFMFVNAASDGPATARIVLFGLEDSLASELGTVLAGQNHAVYDEPFGSPQECLGVVDELRADLVFCSSDRARYQALIEAVMTHRPELPVVVVGRVPEVSEWLDAIEAGASDYCAAPFEASHIEWILDSTLKHHSFASKYRTA